MACCAGGIAAGSGTRIKARPRGLEEGANDNTRYEVGGEFDLLAAQGKGHADA